MADKFDKHDEQPTLRAVQDAEVQDSEADAQDAAGVEEKRKRRGIYLLPNLITTGALFAGFYAIVAAVNGQFVAAALAIFIAALLDAADGRIARLTRTASPFGAQYDSLSDMVAFGVAPAFVAFFWGLSGLGQVGWMASFIFLACAALRLARFNTQHDDATFQGLASPSAAAIIASTVWYWESAVQSAPSTFAASVMGAVTVVVGLLMVSNFSYFSPKLFNFKDRVPFIAMVGVVLAFSIVLLDPPLVFLVLSASYALSGPLQTVFRRTRNSKPQ